MATYREKASGATYTPEPGSRFAKHLAASPDYERVSAKAPKEAPKEAPPVEVKE